MPQIYNFVSPHEPFTIRAKSLNVAAMAALIAGNGKFGVENADRSEHSPINHGWNEWMSIRGIDMSSYVDNHIIEIIDALESAIIGNAADRIRVEATLITATDRAEHNHKLLRGKVDLGAKIFRMAVILRKRL